MTLARWLKAKIQHTYPSLLVIVSGLAWYVGNGLTGDYWYLVWLAPIPLLIYSYNHSQRTSFWLVFAACLLGRLSWFAYLQTVVSTAPALLLTLGLAYVFSRILVWSTTITHDLNAWYGVFAYPVLMTSFEFLVLTFSPDGTATSLAYTQADVIPLIQIASLTGSLGITFLVSLFPALTSLGWWAYQRNRCWVPYLLSTALVVYGLSFVYIFHRFSAHQPLAGPKVGLVALEEKRHHKVQQTTAGQLKDLLKDYSVAIGLAVDQGSVIVVLPETAIRLSPETDQLVMASLKEISRHYQINLVVGLADFSQAPARNLALVLNTEGKVVTAYTKNHLVSGFERHFMAGHQVGLIRLAGLKAGVAICKDLDFPGTIRPYGRASITGLFVPANDFVVDAWLHSRMAVLRGVENGFSLVRTARQGRLTISDDLGQVLYETSTSAGNRAILVGHLPAAHGGSFYARTGNWFGLINLVFAVSLLWRTWVIRRHSVA